METFEPGISSAYSLYTFKVGEQGMKCTACPKVMTMEEWEEKRRCFCQSINAIPAIARSTPPTRLQTNQRIRVTPPPIINPPITPIDLTVNSRSRNTNVSSNSSFTNVSPSRRESSYSSNGGGYWGCAILVFAIIATLSWCSNQFRQSTGNSLPQPLTSQISQPQLTPKQVIEMYYQLAPSSDRKSANMLLSDAYKNWYKQKNININDPSSFWNTINKVEVFKTEIINDSKTNQTVKTWLKYFSKNGEIACESQKMEVVFDSNKSQWLIDNIYDPEYNQECDI
jgi:hypothetical protein